MNRLFKIACALPRTVWFNLRYLPLRQALKLPVWLAPNVRVKRMHRGGMRLGVVRTGIVRFGFHEADAVDVFSAHTVINIPNHAVIECAADVHIGQGAILCVNPGGRLRLGKNFAISGTSKIVCSDSISFGDDVQLSWDSLIMDSDAHHIFDENGNEIPNTKPIVVGNRVWIAANTTVLKGTVIGDDSVVAGRSLLNKAYPSNSIIGGIPAKTLKKISSWHL